MKLHSIRTHREAEGLARNDQLAWKIAAVAADPVPVEPAVADMIVNRIIDNAAVALAGVDRRPVAVARAQAIAHARRGGATVFGLPGTQRFSAEWAAWANGTAVRELDFHDTFLAADFAHPADNIPPVLAVAQQCGRTGADLLRGIAAGYEIQVDLTKGICLHRHRIDHVAHLSPSAAAGIGALLGLDPTITYQAVQHALHVTTATRQSRKGAISSWKASAPAHAGKLAIEAVDRAMRGQTAPSPIYEGEDGVIAWLLDGPDTVYHVPLPEPGESKRAILETYTKAHSAEYQAQALIDLASRLGVEVEQRTAGDWDQVADVLIRTSHHTHVVIGSGANDPQKRDPEASRETLDHSILYIVAVALQDRRWHHIDSYRPERAGRPDTVRLWHKVRTVEDPHWTRRYHADAPEEKAFGGRIEITLASGQVLADDIAVADAHPLGARPYERTDYIGKFRTLTAGIVAPAEQDRFLEVVQTLPELPAARLAGLTVSADPAALTVADSGGGIF